MRLEPCGEILRCTTPIGRLNPSGYNKCYVPTCGYETIVGNQSTGVDGGARDLRKGQ